MDLKLARTELSAKPKKVTLSTIEKSVEQDGQSIIYFDKENSHKDLVELVEYFEGKSSSVYLREVRFGLSEGDYMYEVHIL